MANRIWLPDHATLDDRATEINRLLGGMTVAEGKMGRRRWEAGVELLAVQRLVPRGEWQAWCDKNIARSQSDIRKIMSVAASLDPFAAHEEEKEANREYNDKYRSSPKRSHEIDRNPEQAPAPAPTSNQPPKLTLVPKVDVVEQFVDTWIEFSAIDKRRAFDRISSLMEVSNVALRKVAT
jgi:hypothetical protein